MRLLFLSIALRIYYSLQTCGHTEFPFCNRRGVSSVKVNYELKRLLLSYAPNIKILSPQSLVEEHADSLRRALGRYE